MCVSRMYMGTFDEHIKTSFQPFNALFPICAHNSKMPHGRVKCQGQCWSFSALSSESFVSNVAIRGKCWLLLFGNLPNVKML